MLLCIALLEINYEYIITTWHCNPPLLSETPPPPPHQGGILIRFVFGYNF
jgi:hypothetical protein